MFNLGLSLLALGSLVFGGNWVATYGTIDTPSGTDELPLITNFSECVAAGYPVLESYPEQCRTETGEVFTKPLTDTPSPTKPGVVSEPAPATNDEAVQLAAVAAVRTRAAQDLGVTEETIDVTEVTPAEWPDGCLGLGGSDQICIMMITHGYEITLVGNGETVTYRTDQTGAVIKKETRI